MNFPGTDSIFPKETTVYKPRHTEEGPSSLLWKQRTDVEATSTTTVVGKMWYPSECMPLPFAGSLLGKAHNSPLKSPVLTVLFIREGKARSEGTKGYVSS